MSDCTLLARVAGPVPIDALNQVAALLHAIQQANIEGIRNLHPAYNSLLVVYSPCFWTPQGLLQRLQEVSERVGPFETVSKVVTLPVCFATRFAPDLTAVCASARLEPGALIALFTSCVYRVAFIGFAPGFAYLLGLPPGLATPRHARPRTHVPAGSVGIAGEQTGIYPADTPGGWQLIGRSPLRLFDPDREPMSLLQTGDEVRFSPIDELAFEELSRC